MTNRLSTTDDLIESLRLRRKSERIWFYQPQWYWHGWSTLTPIARGHDDIARWCIMLGWTITGRVIIPLWDCGDPECHLHAIENAEDSE